MEVEEVEFVGGKANVAAIREWIGKRHTPDGSEETWFITKQGHNLQAWAYVREPGWTPDVVAAIYDYLTESWAGVRKGDWIVRGTRGEFTVRA